MDDAELQSVLRQEEKGLLCPERRETPAGGSFRQKGALRMSFSGHDGLLCEKYRLKKGQIGRISQREGRCCITFVYSRF